MKFLLPLCFLLCTILALAQEPDETPEIIIEDLINQEDGEVSFDFDTQFETLQRYAQKPLNLNIADRDDLLGLGLLTVPQIDALLKYKKDLGKLLAIYELQVIPLFDLNTINKILPYVVVTDRLELSQTKLQEQFVKGDNELFTRFRRVLELPVGYQVDGNFERRYAGDANRYYMRYRHTFENTLSYGITMEKDAGEAFGSAANPYGFDFYSVHLFFKNLNPKIKYLALGDFEARFGQGLILWSGFGIRKSSLVNNIKRQAAPLRQYTSVNEATFLRGAGATIELSDRLEFTVFGSLRKRDGRFNDFDSTDIDDEFLSISSLQLSGFHRTAREIEAKNTIEQYTAGASIKYDFNNGYIGLNSVYHQLSVPLRRTVQPYNQFLFQEDKLLNISVDYSYSYRNFYFFGETAMSQNLGLASLNGLYIGLNRVTNLSVLYRHYEKDYQHLSGGAFGESSRVNNEYGLYLGLEFIPSRQWTVSFYADQWRHPWLLFTADLPSRGFEYLGNISYRPTKKSNIALRFRTETKERNAPNNETAMDFLIPINRKQLRLSFQHKTSRTVTLKSRIEFSKFNNTLELESNGFLAYQEVKYKNPSFPVAFSVRYTIFDTDDFDSRIYSFESDLLYNFSVPALYGKGYRYYLNCSYRPLRNLLLEGRIAQTVYAGQETIGSGLEEIQGNTRTEVKIQARWKF